MRGALVNDIVPRLLSGDHPRGCGEHFLADHHREHAPGIIPADAGSTLSLPDSQSLHWDHPRGCGEHRIRQWGDRPGAGSSPRMRGALTIAV